MRLGKRLGIIFLITLCLVLGCKSYSQNQYSAIISKMETSLFGVDYPIQSDEARLKRIEEVVYGQASGNTVSQRVNKLSKDLSADLIGQEIKPKRDSFEEEDAGVKEEDAPKADSSVNYPIVNDLEKTVFNKVFKNIDINNRLSNLEKKVFQKTYNDDLSARVDRLKMAVMPDKIARQNGSDSDDEYAGSEDLSNLTSQFQDYNYERPQNIIDGLRARGIPSYNSRNSVLDDYHGDSDVLIPLATLEKSILKKSFPDDTTSNRITRLELAMFNSTFVDDDEQARIDRLTSAYQAQKTSKKYDGNKFSQHMSTAVQLGAILLMMLAAIL